jgi:putative membrane protein
MAISAVYELIEWGAALALGQGADEFLGTQGDPWDTQPDMFFALIGAAVTLLRRWQDRQRGGYCAKRGRSAQHLIGGKRLLNKQPFTPAALDLDG